MALRKRQEVESEVAEVKMLRFFLGEWIGSGMITHIRCFGEKVREARLIWFGHVQRRDREYISRRMMRFELPGRRSRGRPQRRFMDVVRS